MAATDYFAIMGKMTAVTAELDEETLVAIERLASESGQSREAALVELVRCHCLADDPQVRDGWARAAQIGADAIARGDVVPHDEVVREIDEMIARHRAR